MFNKFLAVILATYGLSLSGCDQVFSKKEFSEVFGQELKWDTLPPIDATNLYEYTATGECISDLRTDVTIYVDEPVVTTVSVPCIENKFSANFDFSTYTISVDFVKMRAEHVGYPLEALSDVPHEAALSLEVANATTVNLALVNQNGSNYTIDWGDGTRTSNVNSSDSSYTSKDYGVDPFTGIVRIFGIQRDSLLELRHTNGRWAYDMAALPPNLIHYTNDASQNRTRGSLAALPANLMYYRNLGSNLTTGDISSLPTGLIYYRNEGSNTTTGDIAQLPVGIEHYENGGRNTTSGNIAGLPSTLIFFRNEGNNTTTGDIGDLPLSLVSYFNRGNNSTFGNINSFKPNLTSYRNFGNNTTTGDIADLSVNLINYENQGNNTTFGNISSLKPSLRTYVNGGNNTTTGNISEISPDLVTYENRGQNTVTGNLADIPASVRTYYSSGPAYITGSTSDLKLGIENFTLENPSNDLTGDIALLPGTLREFIVSGLNTLFGDIADLPNSLRVLNVRGNNTISGDIGSLTNNLREFILYGLNTTTGDIANLPGNLNNFNNRGLNTTFGFINTLKAAMRNYINIGNNTTTSNGTGFIPLFFHEFSLLDETPRTETEIDNILITLSNVTDWSSGPRRVDLRGLNNSAPGPAGVAAIAILNQRNCTVFTN